MPEYKIMDGFICRIQTCKITSTYGINNKHYHVKTTCFYRDYDVARCASLISLALLSSFHMQN